MTFGTTCDKFGKALNRAPALVSNATRGARGIVFLSAYRLGCIVTVRGASGALVVRRNDGRWSNPCALRMAGVALGADIGVENSDMIVVLKSDKAVSKFMSGSLTLGLNGCLAVGTLGRSVEGMLFADDEAVVYSFSKGIYGGVSVEFSGNKECYTYLRSKDQVVVSDFLDASWQSERPAFAELLHKVLDASDQSVTLLPSPTSVSDLSADDLVVGYSPRYEAM